MIAPISLRSEHTTVTLSDHARGSQDKPGDRVAVEAWIIDSGPLKGNHAAYVRYLSADPRDGWNDPYFQTITPDREHKALAKTYDAALHWVMALAYEQAARELDQPPAT